MVFKDNYTVYIIIKPYTFDAIAQTCIELDTLIVQPVTNLFES